MNPRTTGFLLLAYAILAAVLRVLKLSVPVLKVPFVFGGVLGWLACGVIFISALVLLFTGKTAWNISPQTAKKLRRFRAIRRGYVAFVILLALGAVASLDTLIVGKRALMVSHSGKWYFPFVTEVLPGTTFGLKSDAEADYRDLQARFRLEQKGDWVLLPLVPYDSALDSPAIIETVALRDGKVFRQGETEPFNGTAYSVFIAKPEQQRQEWQFRHGLRQGDMRGWDLDGQPVEKASFEKGVRVSYTDFSDGKAAALESQAHPELRTLIYPPAPPSWSTRHYLGTNSTGIDVLAMLYGGLQQSLGVAVLYLIITFAVGLTFGSALGFFGGVLDMVGQRLIEIWSVLPFLFVVMIISSLVSPTLLILVTIVAAFGWMETANYIRTATYKEKERDYVAAARLLGAGTPRIIFHHVLPNVIAILVTLAPFKVAGVITSLAALDFLGFGLPPDVPSWGRLLHEGVDNFSYPWIVTSAFTAMASVLILVTFVGEAVREAFDPKKFTTYE
ncbi:MAG: ABC transporter permease subunit [Verrucomicrobiaceae bacterium]|nr:ABC transporter permease subunit [Verrucomicrobiaceae bacterium]